MHYLITREERPSTSAAALHNAKSKGYYYYMNKSRWITKGTPYLYLALMIIIAVPRLLRTFDDPDFFWHLKTGEWVWQNKTLPDNDPFAFTSEGRGSEREHIILSAYWLTQALYYLLYTISGFPALVLLRFFIVSAIMAVMWIRKEGDRYIYASFLLIFLTYMVVVYPQDRPHLFSFLFFAVLLWLLNKLKDTNNKPAFIIGMVPLTMLIWANMHGGFILGQVTIVLSCLAEGLKFLLPALRPITREAFRNLLIAGIAGIIVSFVNPNAYLILLEYLQPESMMSHIIEYFSPHKAFLQYGEHAVILYWIIIIAALVACVVNRKVVDITDLGLLAGTGYLSLSSMRYVAFFFIAALPFAARSLSGESVRKPGRIFFWSVALIAGIYFTLNARPFMTNVISRSWVDTYSYPVEAADFIIQNDMRGNMYNHYSWGGYLIWRLAPDRKVFIDGRTLDEDVFMQARLIDSARAAPQGEPPGWKMFFDYYDINYVVIPFFQLRGEMLPLVYALSKDNDWVPIFFRGNSFIFARNSSQNSHLINNFAISKKMLFE
ncbi:MAG: hypothetical protein HZA17_05375 [Nitrospirae bacterium]|nr:hypothetical protein [Nitrospirota bacterium]